MRIDSQRGYKLRNFDWNLYRVLYKFYLFFSLLETGKKVGIVVEKGDSYKKKGDSCKITISDFFPSKIWGEIIEISDFIF